MHDAQDFPGPLQPVLNELEAFDAMRIFLEAYWERGLRASDDVAVLLGNIDRRFSSGGEPLDIAQWDDWLEAVRKVKAGQNTD
jgi:hypothetical protein